MHLTKSHSLFVPWREKIVTERTGLIPKIWQSFFEALENAAQLSGQVNGQAALTAQSAAIAATALDVSLTTGGALLRLTYALQLTVAAGTSSSLTVTLRWTSNAVACSQAFAAFTLNDVSKVQSGTILVNVDEETTVTYEVAYTSVGAPAAQYSLDVLSENMP